jgi:hypothetical protein
MQAIWNLSGKAAVFARGFMEHYQNREDDKKPITLRECQEAGAQAVADLGDEISVAYISKLGREITKSKIVGKVKTGRNYYLVEDEETDNFFADLELYENWGKDLNPDAMEELTQRTEIIEYMKKFRGVVIEAGNQLPKAQYSFLMKKFNEGKIKMAFMYEDQYVFLTDDHDWGVSHLDEITTVDKEPFRG